MKVVNKFQRLTLFLCPSTLSLSNIREDKTMNYNPYQIPQHIPSPVQSGGGSGWIIALVILYIIFAPFLPLNPIDEVLAVLIGIWAAASK